MLFMPAIGFSLENRGLMLPSAKTNPNCNTFPTYPITSAKQKIIVSIGAIGAKPIRK